MSLGTELISELAKRKLRGAYFDYKSYRKLRHIDSAESLAIFLKERGFSSPKNPADVVLVADILHRNKQNSSSAIDWLAWIACYPFLGLLFLPIWMLWSLFHYDDIDREINSK